MTPGGSGERRSSVIGPTYRRRDVQPAAMPEPTGGPKPTRSVDCSNHARGLGADYALGAIAGGEVSP